MHLGNAGAILEEMYREGLTVEQAIERRTAVVTAPPLEPETPSFVRREALPEEPQREPVEGGAPTEELLWVPDVAAGDESGEASDRLDD
jgi:hypothetical protein